MLGIAIVGSYFFMLIQLQSYMPWFPWFALLIIFIRYVIVLMPYFINHDEEAVNIFIPAKERFMPTQEHFSALKNIMSDQLFGQNHVITQIIEKIKLNSEIPKRERPLLSAAFFGPPGIGKTSLAKAVNNALFEQSRYFLQIDSAQYNSNDPYGAVTPFLINNGERGVVLIDEPDRVNGNATFWMQSFMPFMDGMITEISTQKKFSTRNTVIIFASNYRHEELAAIAEEHQTDTMSPTELATVMRQAAINVLGGTVFPVAFLNRLDFIGIFAPLTQEMMADIVLKTIVMLAKNHSIEIEFINPDVVQTAIRIGLAEENPGARTLNRWVEINVNPALADAKRQQAKKVKIILGPDSRVFAQIVESQDSPAGTFSMAKMKP